MRFRFVSAFALATIAATAGLGADGRPIDAQRSTLTVRVFKSGLFSAFADNHVVRAPIATGSISLDGTLAVEIGVRSAGLTVLDPDASAATRAEVQAKMLGPEVLDSARYPDIRFASTEVAVASADRWTVTGLLTLHGQTRSTTFTVTRQDGRFRGTVALKQTDFGIRPIRIMGGTVNVRDEVKVEFDIVPVSPGAAESSTPAKWVPPTPGSPPQHAIDDPPGHEERHGDSRRVQRDRRSPGAGQHHADLVPERIVVHEIGPR